MKKYVMKKKWFILWLLAVISATALATPIPDPNEKPPMGLVLGFDFESTFTTDTGYGTYTWVDDIGYTDACLPPRNGVLNGWRGGWSDFFPGQNSEAQIVWDADRQSNVLDVWVAATIDPCQVNGWNSLDIPFPGENNWTMAPAGKDKVMFDDLFTWMAWVKPIDRNGDGSIAEECAAFDLVWERQIMGTGWGIGNYGNGQAMKGAAAGLKVRAEFYDPGYLTFYYDARWDGGLDPCGVPITSWDPCSITYDGRDVNGWHLLMYTWDGQYVYSYVDGVLYDSRPTTNPNEDDRLMNGWATHVDNDHGQWWTVGAHGSDGGPSKNGLTQKVCPWLLDDVGLFRGYCPPESVAGLHDGTYDMFNVPLTLDPPPALPNCESSDFVAEPNLVGWWHFENGDLSNLAPGAATEGQLVNLAEVLYDPNFANWNVDYPAGWALHNVDLEPLDPNDPCDPGNYPSYAQLDNSGEFLAMDNNGFTICAWIKQDVYHDDPNFYNIISRIVDTNADPCVLEYEGIFMNVHAGGVRFGMNLQKDLAGGRDIVEGGWGTVQADRWYHIAGVYDPNHAPDYDPEDPLTWAGPDDDNNNRMAVYINGFVAGEKNDTAAPSGPMVDVSAGNWTLGGSVASADYQGWVDDFRVYQKPLTKEEIQCVMHRVCAPWTGAKTGDLNQNCAVNFDDLDVMAGTWLNSYDYIDFAALASNWLDLDIVFPNY